MLQKFLGSKPVLLRFLASYCQNHLIIVDDDWHLTSHDKPCHENQVKSPGHQSVTYSLFFNEGVKNKN